VLIALKSRHRSLSASQSARTKTSPATVATGAVPGSRSGQEAGWPGDPRSGRPVGVGVAEPSHAPPPGPQRWTTREDLRLAIMTWIEKTYHRRRRQRRLGRLTPIEFETLTQAAHAA
jgi:hypothetical protein